MVSVHCFHIVEGAAFTFALSALCCISRTAYYFEFTTSNLHLKITSSIMNVFFLLCSISVFHFQLSTTIKVKLTLPRQYCTLEDLCWCISDYMGHFLFSYTEQNRLFGASPVSCASTYPCRAKIQSEIPHGALSSCLHPFWQNLHFLWLSTVYAICLPFRPLCPRFPFD